MDLLERGREGRGDGTERKGKRRKETTRNFGTPKTGVLGLPFQFPDSLGWAKTRHVTPSLLVSSDRTSQGQRLRFYGFRQGKRTLFYNPKTESFKGLGYDSDTQPTQRQTDTDTLSRRSRRIRTRNTSSQVSVTTFTVE